MRSIITITLLLFSIVLSAQNSGYPINVRNTVIGYQTTGEGVFYRGDTIPTFTPEKRYGTYMYVDTVRGRVHMFINPTIRWRTIGPDSLTYNSSTQIVGLKNSNDVALVMNVDTTLLGYNTSTQPLRVDTSVIATKYDIASLNTVLVGEVVGPIRSNRLSVVDRVVFNQTYTYPDSTAKLQWDDTDGTLSLGLKGGNVTLQLGQEEVLRVVNKTNANLLQSQYRAVKISSAQGQRLAIQLAQANVESTSTSTIGLVTEDINNNQEGFITVSGKVNKINTTGSLQGETWVDGDQLYLSATVAGGITKVRPEAPNHTVIIGWVVYAHANNGSIFVKVNNGYELDELHNVKITQPVNGAMLIYNDTFNVWKDSIISNVVRGTGTPGQVTYWGNNNLQTGNNALYWSTVFNRLYIDSTGYKDTYYNKNSITHNVDFDIKSETTDPTNIKLTTGGSFGNTPGSIIFGTIPGSYREIARFTFTPTGEKRRLGIGTDAPEYTLDLNTNDGVKLPSGADNTRPSSSAAGVVRYSTATNGLEYKDNDSWEKVIKGTGANNRVAIWNGESSVGSDGGFYYSSSILGTNNVNTGYRLHDRMLLFSSGSGTDLGAIYEDRYTAALDRGLNYNNTVRHIFRINGVDKFRVAENHIVIPKGTTALRATEDELMAGILRYNTTDDKLEYTNNNLGWESIQKSISLTTNGSSGNSTFSNGVLNIPKYKGNFLTINNASDKSDADFSIYGMSINKSDGSPSVYINNGGFKSYNARHAINTVGSVSFSASENSLFGFTNSYSWAVDADNIQTALMRYNAGGSFQGTGYNNIGFSWVDYGNAPGGGSNTNYISRAIKIGNATRGIEIGTDAANHAIYVTAGKSYFQNVGIKTIQPSYSLDISGEDGIKIPVGADGTRPTANSGVLRYSTTSKSLEFYDDDSWETVTKGSGSAGRIAYWNGTNTQTGSSGLTYTGTSTNNTLTIIPENWTNGSKSTFQMTDVFKIVDEYGFPSKINSTNGIDITVGSNKYINLSGETKISDLTTTTPNKLVGADGNGVLSSVTIGGGLSFTNGTLASNITNYVTTDDYQTVTARKRFRPVSTITTDSFFLDISYTSSVAEKAIPTLVFSGTGMTQETNGTYTGGIITGITASNVGNAALTFIGMQKTFPVGGGGGYTLNTKLQKAAIAEFGSSYANTDKSMRILPEGKVLINGNEEPAANLDVNGTARVRTLVNGTPTKIVGSDLDGDLGTITIDSTLTLPLGTSILRVNHSYKEITYTGTGQNDAILAIGELNTSGYVGAFSSITRIKLDKTQGTTTIKLALNYKDKIIDGSVHTIHFQLTGTAAGTPAISFPTQFKSESGTDIGTNYSLTVSKILTCYYDKSDDIFICNQ